MLLVPDIKEYGKKLGFSSTHNYDTISWEWERSIYNVSGCDPVSFTSKTWTFPIVGTVPYLGYFTPEAAEKQKQKLEAAGLDVWVRTAGAYSTLGWFRDPLLPGMLLWDEAALAETIFHELAHATLWIPGSVDFNESFASFLGEVAVDRYLSDRYGPESSLRQEELLLNTDYRLWQQLLHGLYKDLDSLYKSPKSKEQILSEKQKLFQSLPLRVEQSELVFKERFLAASTRGVWNNARLQQYRTYNTSFERFAALLSQEGNDIPRFINRIQQIASGQKDPFAALTEAVSAP
jgi:predicted aminopeptidase